MDPVNDALRGRLVALTSLMIVIALAVVAVVLMTRDAGGETDGGPLARWTFDEGSGAIAASTPESATPVTLQIIGEPEWRDGAIAIGTSSYLVSEGAVTALADAVATSRELTFELWIDPYSIRQAPLSTIASVTDGRSTDLQLLANPSEDAEGAIVARIRSALTDTLGRPGAGGEDDTLDGGLSHIVVVHAGRTIELFVDGVSVAQEQVGPMVGPSAAARISFGAALDGTAPFAGDLYEAAIYSFALNPGQIQSNLEAGPTGVTDVAAVDVAIEAPETDVEIDPSETVVDVDGDEVFSGIVLTGADGDGSIEVWHGTQGTFGGLGSVQPQLNVIGVASDPDGVREVRYAIPGAEDEIVAGNGPNARRLVTPGSFNLEIPESTVGSASAITVTVVDDTGDTTSIRVPLSDVDVSAAALPLSVDWASVDLVDEAADVVDGRWRVAGNEVVNDEVGYDRLVGIGDTSWDDYEVLVPIEVTDIADVVGPNSNSPGVGVIMRWNGHNRLNPGTELVEQPLEGFRALRDQETPFGAIAWFRFAGTGGRQQLVDHQNTVRGAEAGTFPTGVVHWLRASVITESPGRHTYRMKLWQAGTREPEDWELEFTTTVDALAPDAGSLLLVAHEVEARFGRVTVTEPGESGIVTAEPTSDAIAEWSFDEGFGPTVFDLTGNGLDLGVPADAIWVDGGLLYEGDGGSVSGSAEDEVEAILATREFSLEMWADPNGLEQNTLARLFSIQGASGAFDLGATPLSGAFDSIEARVRASETDFLGRPGLRVGGALDGGLAHIVVTHDAAGVTTVYLDGEEISAVQHGDLEEWPTNSRVSIGSTPTGTATWRGTMLHAALWDRSLDESEIQARLDAGPGIAPAG
ncbi:MAG: LamG-like jellyroll fold domain-containing protein [Actinomycetota bacterium]